MRVLLITLLIQLPLLTACGQAPVEEMSAMDAPVQDAPAGDVSVFGESLIRPGVNIPNLLKGPDPAQMEDAPALGYGPVPHGLQIPDNRQLGAPSSVAWTTEDRPCSSTGDRTRWRCSRPMAPSCGRGDKGST